MVSRRARSWILPIPLALALLLPQTAEAQQQDAAGLSLDSLLNTPVSTAAKYSQTITETAGAVTIITAEDISLFGYRTLAQALGSVRGFYTSYDRNFTYLGVRGFGRPTDYNNRILLLIDGHVMNEGIWGAAQLGGESGVDLATVERIEILRGPGSALYGTGAMFAVINVITQSGSQVAGFEVSGEARSYGGRGTSVRMGRQSESGLEISAAGFYDDNPGRDLFFKEFDSPATNNGIAQGLDAERRQGVSARLDFKGFTLHGRYTGRTKAIPTASFDQIFDASGAQTRDDHAFVEAKYEGGLAAKVTLMARSYFDGYWYSGNYAYAQPETEGAVNRTLGSEATLTWDPVSRNRLIVGAEARRAITADYFDQRAPTPRYDLSAPGTVLSAYLEDQLQITPWLSALGGVRHDSYSNAESATTPRASLTIAPNPGTAFRLAYGSAFRAPNVAEAFGLSAGFKLNAQLRREQVRTAELTWQQRLGSRLLGTASVYNYRVLGLIDLTQDPVDSLFVYDNVGGVKTTGFEIGLDARFGAALRGYASYSYQRARDLGTDSVMSNSPAAMLKLGLSGAIADGVRPSLEVHYESSRRTVYQTTTDAFVLTSASLQFSPRLSGSGIARLADHIELGLRLDNIFDVRYANPGGVEHIQPAIPQDGRTFSLRADLKF
ncbi:MAG: TonB-dependent receptor [Gemmatimonadota bacterium]